jgi:hypothetical protein
MLQFRQSQIKELIMDEIGEKEVIFLIYINQCFTQRNRESVPWTGVPSAR